MTEHTDLTPPTKQKPPKAVANGEAKVAKEPKAAKPPKEPKAVKEPTEKKPRAPRADYGFSAESTIQIVTEKEHSYRGKRLEWFQKLEALNGQLVSKFMDDNKNSEDPPRGWLRFFVQDGTVRLDRPLEATAESKEAA